MSEYNVISVTYDPALLAAAQGFFNLESGWVGSRQLEAATSCLGPSNTLEQLERRWNGIRQIDGVQSLLSATSGASLNEAQRLTAESATARAIGDSVRADTLAEQANTSLLAAVQTTVPVLQRRERQMTVSAAVNAFSKLGYSVRTADGHASTGVVAERQHHLFAVLVEDGGTMQVDVAGLSGDGCVAPVQRFRQALAEEGLNVAVTSKTSHGDDRGGALIRRAAAAATPDLVEGLVQQYERRAGRRDEIDIVATGQMRQSQGHVR